jgi:hypothetical protein
VGPTAGSDGCDHTRLVTRKDRAFGVPSTEEHRRDEHRSAKGAVMTLEMERFDLLHRGPPSSLSKF